MICMTRPHPTPLSLCSCLSFLTLAASAQAQEDWTRHFRVGMSVGLNVKTEFHSSGTFSVSSVGQPTPGQNHTYDDGFVRLDDTGNAVPFDSTTGNRVTTNWGYDNPSQYDPAARTLAFQGTSSYTTGNFTGSDDSPQLGFDLAYGGTFRKWERVAIGFELGFGMTFIDAEDNRSMNASVNEIKDVYPTGTTTLPTAPYTGGFDSAGRPVIDDLPTRVVTTTAGTVTGSRQLDANLYQFRLGPSIRWEMAPRWILHGSAGGVFGVFDGDLEFNEQIVTATTSGSNQGKFGETETTFGGYAGAIVMYNTGHYWEAFLGAHFITMGDVTISGPGRSSKTDLSAGIYLTAGINWSF